jgi:hypothetical protein
MPKPTDLTMLNLSTLRENLKKMMKPKILSKFTEFLEVTENHDGAMLERFKRISETSEYATDCKYAQMAKEFFLKDQADAAAKAICWLYHNWSCHYEE